MEWRGGTDRGYNDPNCPKRLTGGSPTLFVYAPSGTKLTIKSSADLTYSDPAYHPETGWHITASPDGSLYNHYNSYNDYNSYPYLYYEYEPVTFQKPKEGWIIKKPNLESFARNTLSPALKLKPLEEDRLVFELAHASFDIESDIIFLGAIATENVIQKLPLEITPKPDAIHRYHFYVSSISPNILISQYPDIPHLSPIPRSNFMILELGAIEGSN